MPRRLRRRLGPLVWSRCRFPALEASTFPLAVILKRLATDFLVLMPLGRRIKNNQLFLKRARNIGATRARIKQYFGARRRARKSFNPSRSSKLRFRAFVGTFVVPIRNRHFDKGFRSERLGWALIYCCFFSPRSFSIYSRASWLVGSSRAASWKCRKAWSRSFSRTRATPRFRWAIA